MNRASGMYPHKKLHRQSWPEMLPNRPSKALLKLGQNMFIDCKTVSDRESKDLSGVHTKRDGIASGKECFRKTGYKI